MLLLPLLTLTLGGVPLLQANVQAPPQPKVERIGPAPYIALVGCQVWDTVSTIYGVEHGFKDLNLFFGPVPRRAEVIPAKIALTALTALFMRKLEKRGQVEDGRIVGWAIATTGCINGVLNWTIMHEGIRR